MHFALALLITAPLGALAGPEREDARAVNKIPDFIKSWDGRCTSTRSATKTVTSTRNTTKYPRPTTTTIYVVQTIKKTITLPEVTNVFSTTLTLYTTTTATQSTTVTDIVTETITSDIPAQTYTVSTPRGFTPIQSVYPSAVAVPKKRKLAIRGKAPAEPTCIKPSDVKCKTTLYTTVTQRTSTHYTTSTSVAPRQTITKKSTTTLTTTVNVLPVPASQTATFSTTVTLGETVTSTQTQLTTITTTTSLVSGPTPTFYAACAPDNILATYQGRYIDGIQYNAPAVQSVLGATDTAYACCVLCLNTPNCAAAGFFPGLCFGFKTPSCSGNAMGGAEFVTANTPDRGVRVSNSACGQWVPSGQ